MEREAFYRREFEGESEREPFVETKVDPPVSPVEDPASVTQIREILFGQQMRSYEDRIAEFEQRFLETTERMAKEFGERIERIERENQSRIESMRLDLIRANVHQSEALDAATQELRGAVAQAVRALQNRKVDRTVLARILAELAAGLTEDPGER